MKNKIIEKFSILFKKKFDFRKIQENIPRVQFSQDFKVKLSKKNVNS